MGQIFVAFSEYLNFKMLSQNLHVHAIFGLFNLFMATHTVIQTKNLLIASIFSLKIYFDFALVSKFISCFFQTNVLFIISSLRSAGVL